jgi:glycogen operon protein
MKGTFSGSSYADAFYGDYANFNNNGGPQKSVNFITAHDGFTLADLVSYDGKNNSVAWPFGPSDGGNDSNDSWSSNDANHRRQRIRNFYTFLTFARGVPMLVYGDEFGRTQNGNNNPYNIDSVATWNNYNMIATDAPQSVSTGGGGAYINKLGTDTHGDSKNNLFLFTKYLLNLRKSDPVLRQGTYSMPIEYTKNDGSSGFNSNSDRCVRIRMDGSSVSGEDYLICMNMWTDQVSFTIPAADTGKKWVRIVDTAYWAESVDNCWTTATGATISGSYGVNAWSIVVLKAVAQ